MLCLDFSCSGLTYQGALGSEICEGPRAIAKGIYEIQVFKKAAVFQNSYKTKMNQQPDIYDIPKLTVLNRVRMRFMNLINVWLLLCSHFKNLEKKPPS